MTIALNPYINFKGTARDAMEFYKSVFGGELTVGTFKDFNASQDPGDADLVMHAQLEAPGGLTLMASDTPSHMEYKPGTNFSVSLSGGKEDDATLRGYYEKLAAGGTELQPLTTASWGDAFGMVADRFGVTWLVNISAK